MSGRRCVGRAARHVAELLTMGVQVIRHLSGADYDPDFSFRQFLKRFPEQRTALIDWPVGDALGNDTRPFQAALAEMTPSLAR